MSGHGFIVYRATNAVNGKTYIGATRAGLENRKRRHVYDALRNAKGCRVFNAAIRKYGAEAFAWRVLRRFKTADEAMSEEVRLIAKHRPEYNLTSGGRGVNGLPRTEIWLRRMSEAQKGRRMTPERYKIHIESMDHSANYKPVVCLNDGRWFESAKSAAQFYGLSANRVGASTSGREIAARGLHFALSKRPLTPKRCKELLGKAHRRRIGSRLSVARARSRPVVCLADGAKYPSVTAAARAHSISTAMVISLCQKGRARTGGVTFMYADAAAPPQRPKRSAAEIVDGLRRRNDALRRGRDKKCTPVICIDTGKAYESAKAAALAVGAAHATVWNAIRYGNGTAHGLRFQFVDR